MYQLFDINNIFFTVLDYPISYLEFFGTIFNLWCVFLVTKNKILNWPIGLVGVVLFGILFYQIQLYSDLLEQIYYFITGIYGWWFWTRLKRAKGDEGSITKNTTKTNTYYIIAIFLFTIFLGFVMSRIHLLLPQYFVEPASYPYIDAGTTVASFAAQILLVRKRVENWILWILVDIVAIWLYWTKGVVFISLLYAIFLILAAKGFLNWKKIAREKI